MEQTSGQQRLNRKRMLAVWQYNMVSMVEQTDWNLLRSYKYY